MEPAQQPKKELIRRLKKGRAICDDCKLENPQSMLHKTLTQKLCGKCAIKV